MNEDYFIIKKNRCDIAKKFLEVIYGDFLELRKSYIELRVVRGKGSYRGRRAGKRSNYYDSIPSLLEDLPNYINNVFFGFNSRGKRKGNRKAVDFIHAFWVDIDPYEKDADGKKIKEPERKKEAKKEILSYKHRPTMIIDSGNGFHVYWLLKEPVEATEEVTAIAEGINRGLKEELSGDTSSTVHISHVTRLPGTWNVTKEKKVDPHDVSCPVMEQKQELCDIEYINQEEKYSFDDLCKLFEASIELEKDRLSKEKIETKLNYLPMQRKELEEKVKEKPWLLKLICDGDKQGSFTGKSQSEIDYGIIVELVKLGFSDEEIMRIYANKKFAVPKELCRKKKHQGNYLNLTISKVRNAESSGLLPRTIGEPFVRIPDKTAAELNLALTEFRIKPLDEKVYMVLIYNLQLNTTGDLHLKKTFLSKSVYGRKGGHSENKIEDALNRLAHHGFIKFDKEDGSYKIKLQDCYLQSLDPGTQRIVGRYTTYNLPPFYKMNAMQVYRLKAENYFKGKKRMKPINVRTLFQRIGVRDEFRSKRRAHEVYKKAVLPALEKNKLSPDTIDKRDCLDDVREWKIIVFGNRK